MNIKNGLRALLLAQPSILALCPPQTVGGSSVDAVFIETVRQGFKPPYIVVSRTGSDPLGNLTSTSGLRSSEIDIDCMGYTESKAEQIAEAVSEALRDYTGPAGANDTIRAVSLEDSNDFENSEQSGGDQWRYAVTLTFTIHHE